MTCVYMYTYVSIHVPIYDTSSDVYMRVSIYIFVETRWSNVSHAKLLGSMLQPILRNTCP